MEALRIAVCEDSAIEQKRLIFLINGCGIPAVVSAFDSGEALLADFGRGKYDLIFMDIYMEGMTGIDAVTAIRKIDSHVPVAFATTSTEFALESYRLDALKYIEKPVQKKAVMELLELARFKKEQIPSLLLQISGKDVSIPFDQITYAEQMGHAVVFHLHDGSSVKASGKLNDYEDRFDMQPFFRCHKSFLVNLTYAQEIDPEFHIFTMSDGTNVHIRREELSAAKKALQDFRSQDH